VQLQSRLGTIEGRVHFQVVKNPDFYQLPGDSELNKRLRVLKKQAMPYAYHKKVVTSQG
jgi:hypothetical protein